MKKKNVHVFLSKGTISSLNENNLKFVEEDIYLGSHI